MIQGVLQGPVIEARTSVWLVAFVKSCQAEPMAPGPANAEGLVILIAIELIATKPGRCLKRNRDVGDNAVSAMAGPLDQNHAPW
jgi:hypothetical protein